MGIAREAVLLSAAGYLCSAAEDLRALGLGALADEVDAFIATIDLEVMLSLFGDD